MQRIDLIIDALEGMCGDRCNTEYNLCQASVALAAVRELKALKPVGYMDSKGVLFNETTHPHLHTALYPLEVALAQPEPFKPDWVSYRQGVADGAAQPEQEEPLPLVDIGVDVTPGGTHVVACYNRPDAVQEMFYSQFHPLAKPEREPKLSDAGADTNITRGLEPKGSGMVTLHQPNPEHQPWCDYLNIVLTSMPPQRANCNCKTAPPKQEPVAWMMPDYGDVLSASEADGTGIYNVPLYTAPPKHGWVGLTDEEINSLYPTNWFEFARAIEAKLKEKNNAV